MYKRDEIIKSLFGVRSQIPKGGRTIYRGVVAVSLIEMFSGIDMVIGLKHEIQGFSAESRSGQDRPQVHRREAPEDGDNVKDNRGDCGNAKHVEEEEEEEQSKPFPLLHQLSANRLMTTKQKAKPIFVHLPNRVDVSSFHRYSSGLIDPDLNKNAHFTMGGPSSHHIVTKSVGQVLTT